MPKIIAIAAMDRARVIGNKNQLPWHLPQDLKHFKKLTSGHAVLMGRNTFESLPENFRPLPRRKNIIITSKNIPIAEDKKSAVEVWDSLERCLQHYKSGTEKLSSDKLWIIGGAQIYKSSMAYWDELELTIVDGEHLGDAFFPEFENNFELASSEKFEGGEFCRYVRRHKS